jgi:hypothetical protein
MRRQFNASLAITAMLILCSASAASSDSGIEFRALDGGGNNVAHPDWGKAGVQYTRVAAPIYADGIGAMQGGPSARYVSNRIFNDIGQNLFSENGVSQIGWLWGQFIDHTLDLRNETSGEPAGIPFAPTSVDPLEGFKNDFPTIDFSRTPGITGTGTTTANPRQQVNTVNSFIDAWNVYGGTLNREEWLRDGPYDGDMSNNDAQLVLVNNYLPREDARGTDPLTAPPMDLMGALTGQPQNAIVAGDVRANENIGLTGLTTLFAREHNRIASMVSQTLPEQTRFDIARRVVGAEEQYITYNEFLPAMGVQLPAYAGYNSAVDPTLSNEFATVGFRGHSAVNGELQAIAGPSQWSATRLQSFENQGIEVKTLDNGQVEVVASMTTAFGNPGLLPKIGLGPLMNGLAQNLQYKNDELINNKFRSVLFQVPGPGTDPATCAGEATPPGCFKDVQDLGAIDVQRDRDHGIPNYNQLRVAYGLPAVSSFIGITGESTASLGGLSINDPAILPFTSLTDANGNPIPLGSTDPPPVAGTRATTLAARLKAIYGSVGNVDAFVGMVSEAHLPGSELGPLQNAIWTKQFVALRDGDRFFYGNDPYLTTILNRYGIDYRHTLAELINLNTKSNVQADVFHGTLGS